LTPENQFERENEARKTLAQIVGGFFLLAGLYSSVETLTTAREGQITDRFTKAIEQLGAVDSKGDKKLEVRLGGIFALERIARDSKRDHGPVMEVLSAYVRDNASGEMLRIPSSDIQAILTVLGRRRSTYGTKEDGPLVLSTVASRMRLHQADLSKSAYNRADYHRVILSYGILHDSDLTGADLTEADLKDASLAHAKLIEANLTRANLIDATLFQANLTRANLESADLESADLRGADLSGAKNLAQRQINTAFGDADTKLAAGLQRPAHWPTKAETR